MNLRGRTVDSRLRPKTDVKVKPKPPRRSVRNKVTVKNEPKSPKSTSSKSSPKGSSTRSKKRYSKKSKRNIFDDEDIEIFFPPVIKTGVRDLIDVLDGGTADDSKLALEATVIYQCNFCSNFFRVMTDYVKHKQMACTTMVVEKEKKIVDDWNPFMAREIFSLCPSDDENFDDYVIGIRQAS